MVYNVKGSRYSHIQKSMESNLFVLDVFTLQPNRSFTIIFKCHWNQEICEGDYIRESSEHCGQGEGLISREVLKNLAGSMT
jgi:hypothetical protein